MLNEPPTVSTCILNTDLFQSDKKYEKHMSKLVIRISRQQVCDPHLQQSTEIIRDLKSLLERGNDRAAESYEEASVP